MVIDLKSPISRIVGIVIGVFLWICVQEIRGVIHRHEADAEHAAEVKKYDAQIAKGQKIDASQVPSNLQDLVPLAERWGWSDYDVRERVAEKAPASQRLELKMKLTKERHKEIEDWVNGSQGKGLTPEIVAFVCLCSAAEEVAERYK